MGFEDDYVLCDLFCIFSGYLPEPVGRDSFCVDEDRFLPLLNTFNSKLEAYVRFTTAGFSEYLSNYSCFESASQKFIYGMAA